MNILIINQPVGNRGDESAHRGFVKSLLKQMPSAKITVAFFGEPSESIKQMQVDSPNVIYKDIKCAKGKISLAKYSLKYKLTTLLVYILGNYRKLNSLIKNADYVICAPGGICMGPFMNWDHIFWLYRADKYNKPIAYYSRSFGPFSEKNKDFRIFKKISLKLLDSFKYLSIRDNKTMEFADDLGLKYFKSIDSAFLVDVNTKIDSPIGRLIGNDYVVFVPNQLTWQPFFKNANPQIIKRFYIEILNLLVKKFPSSKIVMLPQLFSQGDRNDKLFFAELSNYSKLNNIVVLDDIYSSDIQQSIIKNCKFLIGGRYHSVIFALNNAVPFVSLSYENKMFGILSILHLDNRQIDIRNIINGNFNIDDEIEKIKGIIDSTDVDFNSKRIEAKNIAQNSFKEFVENYFN